MGYIHGLWLQTMRTAPCFSMVSTLTPKNHLQPASAGFCVKIHAIKMSSLRDSCFDSRIIPGIDMPVYRDTNPNGFFIRPNPVCFKNTPGLSTSFNPVDFN
jgi:hypothetical protein